MTAKRAFDLVASSTAILLLFPLLLGLFGLARWKLGKPALFKQTRIGQDGKPFVIFKFRTMRDLRTSDGQVLPDHARLTPFGRLLRSTSLDELPELWNVVCGEMSMVGPRPLLPEYLPRYSARQARRHEIKPGITGWAQIHGRNATTWEERFEHDVWYVDHYSFWLDLYILAKTVTQVLRRDGVSGHGVATMRPFEGSSNGSGRPGNGLPQH